MGRAVLLEAVGVLPCLVTVLRARITRAVASGGADSHAGTPEKAAYRAGD